MVLEETALQGDYEFTPELIFQIKRLEEEISYLQYQSPLNLKRLNKAFEWAMNLYESDESLSRKYVRILNRISNDDLGKKMNTLHHRIYNEGHP